MEELLKILQSKKDCLSFVIENADNGISFFSLKNNSKFYHNPQILTQLGFNKKEVKKSAINLSSFFDEESFKAIQKIIDQKLFEKSEYISKSLSVLNSNNKFVKADLKIKIIVENGNAEGVLIAFDKILKENIAESSNTPLKKESFHFSEFLSLTNDMVFILDKNFNFKRYYGDEKNLVIAPHEFLGKNFKEISIQDSAKKSILKCLKLIVQTNQSQACAYYADTKKGRFWFEFSGTIVKNNIEGGEEILAIVRNKHTQKVLEKNLEVNKEQIKSLLINLPGAAYRCLFDKNWTMIFLSKGIKKLSGYNAEDFIENKVLPFSSIIYDEDQPVIKNTFDSLSQESPEVELEYRIVHKSGKLIWVRERGRGIFNSKGKLEYFDGIIFEITKRKWMEQQLQVVNKQLYQAGKLARVGSWEINLLNNELEWSNITREIHEVPLDMKIDLKNAISFYKKGADRDKISELLNQAKKNGKPWETEAKIITHKGREIWVKSVGNSDFVNGKCVRIYGSFQDIDHIKRNAEKVKSYELLEKLTNSVPGAIYQFEQRKDKSINFEFISENVSFLHKDLNKEAILKNPMLPFNFIHPDDWNGFENSMREAYRNFKDWKYQYRVVNNDGSVFWHEAHSKPELQENGTINWYGYIHNITDLKTLQESLEQKIKEAFQKNRELEKFIQKNRELERFAYIVSHDLKEPLRTIKSFSEIIKSKYLDKLDDDGAVYFDLISSGATRMIGLIEGILEYSKIEEKKGLVESVDVNKIIDIVLNDLKSVIEETNASVKFGKLHKVKCNPLQMRQLFQNLINNAIKFSLNLKSSPQIEISSVEEEYKIIFSVKDNGIGIQPDQLINIFNMFKRLHAREDYKGYGIGLALCKKIVEKHEGDIWAESDGKSGSTFYFSIPK